MLTLNSIVDVRVNAAHAAAVSTTFSTGLILAPAASTTVTDAQRLRLFTSAEDMLADSSGDFTASSPAYLAAKSYFTKQTDIFRACVIEIQTAYGMSVAIEGAAVAVSDGGPEADAG